MLAEENNELLLSARWIFKGVVVEGRLSKKFEESTDDGMVALVEVVVDVVVDARGEPNRNGLLGFVVGVASRDDREGMHVGAFVGKGTCLVIVVFLALSLRILAANSCEGPELFVGVKQGLED